MRASLAITACTTGPDQAAASGDGLTYAADRAVVAPARPLADTPDPYRGLVPPGSGQCCVPPPIRRTQVAGASAAEAGQHHQTAHEQVDDREDHSAMIPTHKTAQARPDRVIEPHKVPCPSTRPGGSAFSESPCIRPGNGPPSRPATLLMDLGEQADRVKFMIHDRGSNFTAAFEEIGCRCRDPDRALQRPDLLHERDCRALDPGCRQELMDRTLAAGSGTWPILARSRSAGIPAVRPMCSDGGTW